MYYATHNFKKILESNGNPNSYPHPGYAWAMNRSYLRQIGKLFEFNIVGSGDKLMAYSALNMWQEGLQKGVKLTQNFINECYNWSRNAVPKKGYGYV